MGHNRPIQVFYRSMVSAILGTSLVICIAIVVLRPDAFLCIHNEVGHDSHSAAWEVADIYHACSLYSEARLMVIHTGTGGSLQVYKLLFVSDLVGRSISQRVSCCPLF